MPIWPTPISAGAAGPTAPAARAGRSASLFEARLAATDAVLHNQDNREHDLLDSDDYYQFEGGLAVAIRHLSGRAVAVYHNDHSQPDRPRIRSLREEMGRIVRGRAANPRWIAGVMRHGYKGAAEIAATVDYLFAFAATARRGRRCAFRRAVRGLSRRCRRARFHGARTIRRRSPKPRAGSARRSSAACGARGATASARRSSQMAEPVPERRRDQPAASREDGAAAGGAPQGARDQDRGARPRHRAYRRRQGQIDGRVRHGAALHRARLQGRDRAVRQGRLEHRRAHRAGAVSRSGYLPRDG